MAPFGPREPPLVPDKVRLTSISMEASAFPQVIVAHTMSTAVILAPLCTYNLSRKNKKLTQSKQNQSETINDKA
jgi:hypothetical protein